MSAKIMGGVYDLDLPSNEQSVLIALADHADHEGDKVFPSNGLVAWKVGMSEDTVSRLKKKLIVRGILVLVSQALGRVNQYKIDLSKGVLKAPFVRRKTAHSLPLNPPQLAGGLTTANPPQPERKPPATATPALFSQNSDGLLENIDDKPPRSADKPPAELCGPNHNRQEPSMRKRAYGRTDLVTAAAFFTAVGLPLSDAEWFFWKCEGNGWTNGGKPIRNWQATVRSWKAGGFMPSQKNPVRSAAPSKETFKEMQSRILSEVM